LERFSSTTATIVRGVLTRIEKSVQAHCVELDGPRCRFMGTDGVTTLTSATSVVAVSATEHAP
jgi:hypothetical protein